MSNEKQKPQAEEMMIMMHNLERFILRLSDRKPLHTLRELQILTQHFFCNMTRKEIGKQYDVTEERIQQLEDQAIEKILSLPSKLP